MPSRFTWIRRAIPPNWSLFSTRLTLKPWLARSSAAFIPAIPPPMTSASLLTPMVTVCRGSSRRALATARFTISLALAVAASLSFMCTQEQCSRMLPISNRKGFRPAEAQVARNRGSCVRGVQDATTTRFSLCSRIISLILSWVSDEQEYRFSSAYTTFGAFLMYSTTDGTSTVEPMLIPQWQTNTPIRGSCPLTSISATGSSDLTRVPRASASRVPAPEAAALACMTAVGMSIGPWKVPHTNTPGREVSTGALVVVAAKPCWFRSTPILLAVSIAFEEGRRPTDNTTMSNSSCLISPPSSLYRILTVCSELPGPSSKLRERMKRMPVSSWARL